MLFRSHPFLPINCTALPEELLESELMGHEKGAFTDAKVAKKGLFEVADRGTVFLDEIGDMKPGLQAKLLRFIEDKTFRRVGGHRDIQVDVRIIAATNRDLEGQVRGGAFREDLYYRLNVVPIFLPPLRDRTEDILPLAEHFLQEFSRDFQRSFRGFSGSARLRMEAYRWPGNVRELRNVIERAIILGAGETIGELDIPSVSVSASPAIHASASPETGTPAHPPGPLPPPGGGYPFPLPSTGVVLDEVERDFIRQALDLSRGNQTRAAESLGLTRDALRYRMKKFGFL